MQIYLNISFFQCEKYLSNICFYIEIESIKKSINHHTGNMNTVNTLWSRSLTVVYIWGHSESSGDKKIRLFLNVIV